MAEIHVGKFINNLDSEDLSSEKLQGVVNNVYAKAISTHKKKAEKVEQESKEQEEDAVLFVKSNHDRLKAHKNKPEKDIDADRATKANKAAREINEELRKPARLLHGRDVVNCEVGDKIRVYGPYEAGDYQKVADNEWIVLDENGQEDEQFKHFSDMDLFFNIKDADECDFLIIRKHTVESLNEDRYADVSQKPGEGFVWDRARYKTLNTHRVHLIDAYEATSDGTPEDTIKALIEVDGPEGAIIDVAEAVNATGEWDGRLYSNVRDWAKKVAGAASKEELTNYKLYDLSSWIHTSHLNQIAQAAMNNKLGEEVKTRRPVKEGLVDPSAEDIQEFEKWIDSMGFDIDRKGRTLFGNVHYQVISKNTLNGVLDETDLRRFAKRLHSLSQKMQDRGVPMTYNVGLIEGGIITAGIDLYQKHVADEKQQGSLTEASLFGSYKKYDPNEGWTPQLIELHKSIDWEARNYEDYEVPNTEVSGWAYLYSENGKAKKNMKYALKLRSNPIYPPYYGTREFQPIEGYTNGMYDGHKIGKFEVHDRFETWDLYNRLSDSLKKSPGKVLKESLAEMKARWEEILDSGRLNVIEFPEEYFYIDIDWDKKTIFAGPATNTGIIREFEMPLELEFTLDENIAALYDYIISERPELLGEDDESLTESSGAKSWVLFFDKDGRHRAGSDWSTPMSVKAPLAKQRTLNHKIVWPNEAEGFIVLTPDHFSGISYDELQKLYNKGGISTGKLDRSIPFTESKKLTEAAIKKELTEDELWDYIEKYLEEDVAEGYGWITAHYLQMALEQAFGIEVLYVELMETLRKHLKDELQRIDYEWVVNVTGVPADDIERELQESKQTKASKAGTSINEGANKQASSCKYKVSYRSETGALVEKFFRASSEADAQKRSNLIAQLSKWNNNRVKLERID